MTGGLEDEPEAGGWAKTRAFGHVAYARRVPDSEDPALSRLWLALRIGNIPLGIAFRAHGAWGIVDVVESG
jgi:hypothetical protein